MPCNLSVFDLFSSLSDSVPNPNHTFKERKGVAHLVHSWAQTGHPHVRFQSVVLIK